MNGAVFAVGIDLGTTHCALSKVALTAADQAPEAVAELPIPQLVAPGEVDARPLLPSFMYMPHESEFPPGALAVPWPDGPPQAAVGELARTHGARSPLRMVSSAKSWLCHPGVDRRAPLLPLSAPEDVTRISPLEASTQYLRHLRAAWDDAHPQTPLTDQQVTITVPASFDPVARELTAQAAREAGLPDAVLLEEPQAALYAWLERVGGEFRDQVQVGDVIVVVDVGGGTTDFSLVAVRQEQGELTLERIAAGEHILLGGENMDLALAYFLKGKLEAEGRKLNAAQLLALTQAARTAKESLLSDPALSSAPVVIPGRGSKLVGGSIKAQLGRDDLERLLVDGFFPQVQADAQPQSRPRAGLTQLGLPYAQDPAITRHLAAFLDRQANSDTPCGHPTAVLFNGGVFKSELLRERMCSQLNRFLEAGGAQAARALKGADLELAVCRGAAYYGQVRSGSGIRIRGGTAMAYYVGIESAMPAVPGMPAPLTALCVAPFGLEEGSAAEMPQAEFGLVVGQPVRFSFFGSSVRRNDSAGTLLEDIDDDLQPLQDIQVTLPTEEHSQGGPCSNPAVGEIPRADANNGTVTVRLQAAVSEVGTLQLSAVSTDGARLWQVEMDTRDPMANNS